MIKILAVDDMLQWRNFHKDALNTILKDIEFSLTLENSANEAIENIKNNLNEPYNLVITDLQMEPDYEPDYAGEWLVKNIQQLSKYYATPIIIVSAAYNVKVIADRLNVHYLSKPSLIHNPLGYELLLNEVLSLNSPQKS